MPFHRLFPNWIWIVEISQTAVILSILEINLTVLIDLNKIDSIIFVLLDLLTH